MDTTGGGGSCIDESTSHLTTSGSPATTVSEAIATDKLCRVGSGASVVVDFDSGGGGEAESRKLPSSQYKGVVPQPNGRWGAQIYEKHQRVWLGTFNEEDEAGKAYDIAAQRFRGRDAITNFKPLGKEDEVESAFLSTHSKAEIVDMLRKHTYNDELEQSRRNYGNTNESNNTNNPNLGMGSMNKACEHLFDKAVTPSDVGKLNRLVIPKQHAEKHFPLQFGASCKGMLLNFEENGICGGKVWRFRYSYWNSSQSYVLTKGWSRFVKEKNLKAGDTVSFLRSTGGEDKKLYIAWKAKPSSNSTPTELYSPIYPIESVNKLVQSSVQVVRLFGVNIFTKLPSAVVDCGSSWNNGGKRNRQVELLSVECCKKPCFSPSFVTSS